MITWLGQIPFRVFLSLGLAAVVAVVCLLSSFGLAQETSKVSGGGAGQTEAQVKSGDQSGNHASENSATDGRVNVTVTPRIEGKGEVGSPPPKGLAWIPWFISVVFSWPFLVAVFAIYLLWKPQRVLSVLLPFQSFKLFGAEFILDRRSGSTAEAAIQVYREAVQEKFNTIAQREQITEKHKEIVDKLLEGTAGLLRGVNFRSTVYVPDILLDESLYQLLDYYPKTPDGGKKGRVFSARYGMIGRCWRLEKSDFKGRVSTNPEDLINEWAMTRKEAKEAAQERQSFACVILKNTNQECLGLFYMDSPAEAAFDSTWNQVDQLVREEAKSNGLIAALQKVYTELIASSARVQIYKR